ncbi:MAG: hypothetical protein PVJ60_00110 [Phycisphaerales bacterium]|jgi:hypothetical protein
MNPEYPIHIPSKGRYEKRLTSDYLSIMKVKYHLIIEDQEYKKYKLYTKDNPFVKLVILDKKYQKNYDACCKLEDNESRGSGPARNFIWDYSISNGFDYHWIMDDNIRNFRRLNNNKRQYVRDGTIFKCIEDFIKRYENVAMGGPNYVMFIPDRSKKPPFTPNTRIYSCNFIRNDVPFRWRGRYNEDTDLSIRMMKAGWCTILFNTFLQQKLTTQKMKGGNTDEIYADGTLEKSKMIARLHPDCTKVVWRFGRWHHYTDYRKFKKIKLKKRKDSKIEPGINDYGMKLVRVANS